MNPSADRRSFLRAAAIALVAASSFSWVAIARSRFPVTKSAAEWRRQLGPKRFAVLREAATERPYSHPLKKEHRRGRFLCAGCAQPLFTSNAKFDSGTGWPSFYRALDRSVITRADRTLLLVRTEVLCSRCGGHLGHLFKDGPKPTGLRYCINGLALLFRPV